MREREEKKKEGYIRPLPVFFTRLLSSVSCQLFRNDRTPREISSHANSSDSHALVEIAYKMSLNTNILRVSNQRYFHQ